jgi:hypothetical protein
MKLRHGWHHALKNVTVVKRCDSGGNRKDGAEIVAELRS